MIETTILGTSSMVPTKKRNHTAIITNFHNDEYILFDCGEGTQRQLRIAGIKPTKIKKIFISHWHGDHTFGLIGLIQTIFATKYETTIKIYGPPGTKEKIDNLMYTFKEGEDINRSEEGERVVYKSEHDKMDLHIHEFEKDDIIKDRKYNILVKKLDHSVDTYGFKLVEKDVKKIKKSFIKKINKLGIKRGPWLEDLRKGKDVTVDDHKFKSSDSIMRIPGKKLGFIFDTRLCDNMYDIAEDVDLLIGEATYLHKEVEKAKEYGHLTAKQLAQVASESNAKKLVMIHFSQRYKSTNDHEREARLFLKDSHSAKDFMKIKV